MYSSNHHMQADRQDCNAIKCPRCGNAMIDIQACHMLCCNCGAHLDCSDKGSYW